LRKQCPPRLRRRLVHLRRSPTFFLNRPPPHPPLRRRQGRRIGLASPTQGRDLGRHCSRRPMRLCPAVSCAQVFLGRRTRHPFEPILTDAEWAIITRCYRRPRRRLPTRLAAMRDIMNSIFYVLRSDPRQRLPDGFVPLSPPQKSSFMASAMLKWRSRRARLDQSSRHPNRAGLRLMFGAERIKVSRRMHDGCGRAVRGRAIWHIDEMVVRIAGKANVPVARRL